MNNQLKAAGKSLLAIILGLSLLNLVTPVSASGGSGGGGGGSSVDTIRVSKCEYAVVSGAYVELLLNASKFEFQRAFVRLSA